MSQGYVLGAISGSKKASGIHIPRMGEEMRGLCVLGPGHRSTGSHVFLMTFPNRKKGGRGKKEQNKRPSQFKSQMENFSHQIE